MVAKRTQRKSKLVGKWFLIWIGLTFVAISSATAGALLAVRLSATSLQQAALSAEDADFFDKENEPTINLQSLSLPELTRPVNVLVLGLKVLTSEVDTPIAPAEQDKSYHSLVNSFDGLSDTMLLMRFDPRQKKVSILSIPRDTQTVIPTRGLTKINEANYIGGPALAARTVSEILGEIPIDRYLRVNVQGIEKFVDTLGGVDVYVPKDLKYTDHSQHLYIDLKQGQQKLNGDQALQFLRFRYDGYGDIGRVQRQQTLIRSILEQSLQPKTILQIPQLLSVVQSHIDTNLTVDEILALAGFADQVDRSNIQMMMLPGEFNGNGRNNQVSYWLPHRESIRKMVAQHFADENYLFDDFQQMDSLTIAIQNASGNEQAPALLQAYLTELGYRRPYIVEPFTETLDTTRFIAQTADEFNTNQLKAKLNFGESLVESTGELNSDITIRVGKDWLDHPQIKQLQTSGN